MKFAPRSLAGRLALVLVLALLAGQAVSFVLLARAQDRLAAERVAYAALLPIMASLDAEAADDMPPRFARRRARRAARRTSLAGSPPDGPRLRRVERAVAEVLAERGLAAQAVRVVRGETEGRRGVRPGLTVSVRRTDGRWISATTPAPPRRGPRLVPLAVQTILIYLVLLLPVLRIARQVARPLGTLTEGARRWRPGAPPATVPPGAPEDVASLARALADMQARIEAADRERDVTLGAIGHDLRTPLTSLRLRAEQVADEGVREKMIATLEETGRLLEDTLTLAGSGHLDGAPAKADLAQLVRDVAASARAAGQLVTLGMLEDVVAPVHREALMRALGNLVANADRYAGGGVLTVRREGAEAVLAVADEGPGLPGGYALAAFARGEGSRNVKTGGSGLGLAIARRVAEAHGGTLALTPRTGGGLVVKLCIPSS